MIGSIALARHSCTFNQKVRSTTDYYGATRGAVAYSGNRPAIEGVRGTAAFYLVGAM